MEENNEVVEKKKNNKKNIILIVIIVIICFISGFFLSKLLNKEDKTEKEMTEKEKKKEETVVDNQKEEQKPNKFVNIEDGLTFIQLDGSYKNIKDVSLKILEKEGSVFNYAMDSDNKIDDIVLEYNKVSYNDKVICDENCFSEIIKVYIVDLNEDDNYVDIVIYGDHASADYGYKIFKISDNNSYKEINLSNSDEIYTNKKGIVVVRNNIFLKTDTLLAGSYFDYDLEKEVNLTFTKVENTLITFKDIYVSDSKEIDISNPSNYYKEEIKGNILALENPFLKIKQEDGSIKYLFDGNGVFGG
ncbi:MAG: hypothetical protein IKQ33_00630 [Clostridia bacterium]|nr:hypothetical protein [Clostridia bacterium]